MKIVFPTETKDGLNSELSEHFGRANFFVFLNEKGEVLKIIENESEHKGGVLKPPQIMKNEGAEVLICKGTGMRALELFRNFGILVYISQEKTVSLAFKKWKENKLQKANLDTACRGEHL